MNPNRQAVRPRWFALVTTSWMLFGTLLLVLMTSLNGRPLPAGVPNEPLPLAGFVLLMSFVYLLPVWLALQERRYLRAGKEPSSFLGYAVGTGSISLLWGLLLVPVFFR